MINFENRLKSLKERRQGSRERAIFDHALNSAEKNRALNEGLDYRKKEAYESLNDSNGVKYAIGAMSAVDSTSTKVSISEGDRVANNLIKTLSYHNISAEKRLQGSVALDIHIKGHSDVDMLILIKDTVHVEYPLFIPGSYITSADPRTLLERVKELRAQSETNLISSFPKVTVDTSGNKSIALEGGSLKRKVDIVPACWRDTIEYQSSKDEQHREVRIYDKGNHEFIVNFPFKHIRRVSDRDNIYSGNLKSVARLLKNMVADMPDYKKKIAKKLTSYDVAAVAYHMDTRLNIPSFMKLSLVEITRSYLVLLLENEAYRNSLYVPDNSRKIFNGEPKVRALEILAKECTDLAEAIFHELKPFQTYDSSVILNRRVENVVY